MLQGVSEETSLSASEFGRLSDAIRSTQFPHIMSEYVKEMADPNNVAEKIQYYRELEASGEVPSGHTIAWLSDPILVARSVLSSFDSFVQSPCKLYIQVCGAPANIESQLNSSDGMPLLISPPRVEQDPLAPEKTCIAVEAVIHRRFASVFPSNWAATESLLRDVVRNVEESLKARRSSNSGSGASTSSGMCCDFRIVARGPAICPLLLKTT